MLLLCYGPQDADVQGGVRAGPTAALVAFSSTPEGMRYVVRRGEVAVRNKEISKYTVVAETVEVFDSTQGNIMWEPSGTQNKYVLPTRRCQWLCYF